MLMTALSFAVPVYAEETSGTVSLSAGDATLAEKYSFAEGYTAAEIFAEYSSNSQTGITAKKYASVSGFARLGGNYVVIGTEKKLGKEQYITGLDFYALVDKNYSDCFDISVSSSLSGTYSSVNNVIIEQQEWAHNKHTGATANLEVYKYTIVDLVDTKYVKIAAKELEGLVWTGNWPVLGAFSYTWLMDEALNSENKVTVNGEYLGFSEANYYSLATSQDDNYSLNNIFVKASNGLSKRRYCTLTGFNFGGKDNFVIIATEPQLGTGKEYNITNLEFYALTLNDITDVFDVSVSSSIYEGFTPVDINVSLSEETPHNSVKTHSVYKYTATNLVDVKYVKITAKDTEGSAVGNNQPIIGAFSYDWVNIYADYEEEIESLQETFKENFYNEDFILNGQNIYEVLENLTLPNKIELEGVNYTVEWSSSDDTAVKIDGEVGNVARSTSPNTVTLKAIVYGNDEGFLYKVYSKEYNIMIPPIGSKIIFWEDFEDAEINDADGRGVINGYNEWTTDFGGEKDLTDTALFVDPEDDLNKVMWLYQFSETGSVTANKRTFDQVSSGKVELSFKHMTPTPSTSFRIVLAGLDMNITRKNIVCYGSLATKFTGIKDAGWKANVWHEYRFVLDIDKNLMSVYCDGEQLISDFLLPKSTYLTSDIKITTRRASYFGTNYIDDVCIRDLTPDPSVAVELEADYLSLPETVSSDIDLPSYGIFDSAITWSTSDAGVIDNNGIVTLDAEEKDVVLHAIVRNGDYVTERDFNVKVLSVSHEDQLIKNEETLQKIAKRFSLKQMLGGQSSFNIVDDFSVVTEYNAGDAGRLGGCKISWSSDNTEAVKNNGKVTRLRDDVKVTLTAEFSFVEDSSIKTTVNYPLIVAGEGEYTSFYDFNEQQNGESVSVVDGMSISDLSANGIFYGLWQSPDDLLNGAVIASRNQIGETSSDFVAETNFEGNMGEIGLSFYLASSSGKIEFRINGVDIPVCITSTNIKVNEKETQTTVTAKEWHKIAISFNDYDKLLCVYLDGEQISDSIDYSNELNITSISVSNNNGSIGIWYIDDLYAKNTNVSNEEAFKRTLSVLEIENVAEWNITLPVVGEYGTRFQWTSNKPDVLNSDGVVFRTVGGDTTVILTAKVSREDKYDFKEFTVLVPGLDGTETPSQEKFEEHVMEIGNDCITDEKPYRITKDLDLFDEYSEGNSAFYGGMNVEWQSDYSSVIDADGVVRRPILDTGVRLTATFTSKRDPEIKAQKDFVFIVLAPGDELYFEDFESITPEMLGTSLDGFKGEWIIEAPGANGHAQDIKFKIDPLDDENNLNEANKTVWINRFELSAYSQRALRPYPYAEKTMILEGDALVASFRLMFMTSTSVFNINFGGMSINITTKGLGSSIKGTYKDGYTLSVGEWHDFTFILCPEDNVIYYMVDGRRDLMDSSYYTFAALPSYQTMLIDSPRKTAVSELYFDDLSLRVLKDSDAVAVSEAVSQLSLPDTIEHDYILPSFGKNRTIVKWTSQNPKVILDDGKIVGTGKASLKAVVKRGACMEEKTFNINVIGPDCDFVISDVNERDNIIDSVTFSRIGDISNAELILVVYNKGKLSQIRNTKISGLITTFEPIDVSEYYDCEVKVYVMENSNIVSNVFLDH